MKTHPTRRRFLQLTIGGVIGVTLGGKALLKPARAEDIPHLTEDDPQAAAMKYVHKSPDADKICSGCALLQGNEGDEWRPCTIFPGKLVSADGWCSAWVARED